MPIGSGMARARRALLPLIASFAALLVAAGTASAAPGSAADSVGLPLATPASQTIPPPGFRTSARQAVEIALSTRTVSRLRGEHARLTATAYVWAGTRWEVDFGTGGKDLAEVDVSSDGGVLAVWTGVQVDSYQARGHFGGLFDSPFVFVPFALLFLVPFVDPRRPLRLLHLDLLAMLSFGVSYLLFTGGRFYAAVPMAYPPLLYLLGRLLVAGFRGRRPAGKLVPLLSTPVLAAGALGLMAARVVLGLVSGRPVDVGYASVVGADRIWHHLVLYVNHSSHGDTYGPLTYLAYAPFERLFPWHGRWDYLPAAHAAAITFDLLTALGLFLVARRFLPGRSGNRLGFALVWGWAAFPFTLLGLMKGTNDGLVAMLLVYAMLAFASPIRRGAILGVAAAAKFFPLALLPLFATGRGERGWRRPALTAGSFAVVAGAAIWAFLPPEGIGKFFDATIGYQLHRHDSWSLWGLHPSLGWLQTVAAGLAVVVAIGVAAARRSRSSAQVAALAGAVIIAAQIPATHWFYFYIPWFVPFALVALFGAFRGGAEQGEAEWAAAADLLGRRRLGEPLPDASAH
ncbi:MAG: DUF2029 domain-containing protein [Actinobacteria bacterium]|nr:DUF2029 domain-containing protein [Actinomycetota bacterium]